MLAHQFKAAARTIGPIRHTAARSLESPAKRGRSEDFDARGKEADTLEVNDVHADALPRACRIAAPHGLSHHERDLLSEGLDHMRERGPCVFVSVEAGREPGNERIVRGLTRKLKSVIAQHQRRAGMRRAIFITVFEALGRDKQPKFGAHVVALMPNVAARDKLVDSLNGSKVYARHVLAEPVTDWPGLTGYLLKEATPQAWWGARKRFRRVGGPIPLGELGGDRVVPSNDLKDALLRAERIKPYRRTYAKRRSKAPVLPAENVVKVQFAVASVKCTPTRSAELITL